MKTTVRPSLFTAVIYLSLWCLLTLPAIARDALTPAEAPQIFIESVYKLNYKTAWEVLSTESQNHFVSTVVEMEKNNTLNKAQIQNYFATADRALRRGFWNQFRRSMDVIAWSEQRFTTGEAGPDGLVWVDVQPANIRVLAKQEGSNWKFAFYESFIKPKQPKPPVPSATSSASPNKNKK
jgi:hypothetical protein